MEKVVVRGPLDGNIFAIIAAASRELKRAGRFEDSAKMVEEATSSGSYHEALGKIMDYVDIEL